MHDSYLAGSYARRRSSHICRLCRLSFHSYSVTILQRRRQAWDISGPFVWAGGDYGSDFHGGIVGVGRDSGSDLHSGIAEAEVVVKDGRIVEWEGSRGRR